MAAGARRASVLAIGVLPFGMVYGVAVADAGLGTGPGLLGSVAIFAGASQLSLVELHDSGAFWAVAVGTALVVNARFVLYSAALAPAFSEFPRSQRYLGAHLMTDQAVALAMLEYRTETDPRRRRGFYLGAALTIFSVWQLGTVVGLLAGGQVPDGLQLGFIIPLMFTALVVPALRDRPAIAAAVVSVVVALATSGLPAGTNILLGAVGGMTAGALSLPARPVEADHSQASGEDP